VLQIAALVILLALGTSCAAAQVTYPVKSIRLIVPYSAGGGADIVSRPIAIKLGEALGQPIVVENRAGGGGLIAGEIVARSAPDGYTLLVGAGYTHIFATLLNDKVPYDPVKDYAPITKFAEVPNVLVSRPSFPPKTVQELVSYGKANPGKINWASAGSGSSGHLGLVLFSDRTGIKVTHVPYKGAAPASAALLGGEADLIMSNISVFFPHIKAGRLRGLAIAAEKRVGIAPDLPTLAEAGVPNVTSGSFYGLLAPARTPRPIIDKLRAEVMKIITTPQTQARFESEGTLPATTTPEEFVQYLKQELEKWGRIVRQHGIKAA
jgi:tripartite-type tricarboxylate transporter receptor subunit TctC